MPSPIFIDHKEKRMENEKVTALANDEKAVTDVEDSAKTNAAKKAETVKKAIKELYKGTLKLSKPIRAASEDITELHYDFTTLTGWDYVDAMDSDTAAKNMFKVTSKQALSLFAVAAAKKTDNVDAKDIKERIGIVDAAKAVQLATVFLVTSTKEEKANT